MLSLLSDIFSCQLIQAQVAVKYFEYYDKLTKMLEELSEDIEVLDLYTRNNSESSELHEVGLEFVYTKQLKTILMVPRL